MSLPANFEFREEKNKANSGTHGTIWPFYDKVNTTRRVYCVNTERGFKQELTAFPIKVSYRAKEKSFPSFTHLLAACREKVQNKIKPSLGERKKKSSARMKEKFDLRMWEISFQGWAFFARLFTFLLRYTLFPSKSKMYNVLYVHFIKPMLQTCHSRWVIFHHLDSFIFFLSFH